MEIIETSWPVRMKCVVPLLSQFSSDAATPIIPNRRKMRGLVIVGMRTSKVLLCNYLLSYPFWRNKYEVLKSSFLILFAHFCVLKK